METFRCSACGFKTRKNFELIDCDYCGKKGTMRKIESADKLV